MKKYQILDDSGRLMVAEKAKDGCLKVTMTFYPNESLTMEEVCDIMGWEITKVIEYTKPKVLPLKGKG